MNNTLKVAKWEIQRNIKNRTFLISILLTPLIMLIFAFIPTLLTKLETDKSFDLYLVDNLGIYENITQSPSLGNVNFILTTENRQQLEDKVRTNKDQGFVIIDDTVLEKGQITIYTDTEGQGNLAPAYTVLQSVLHNYKLRTSGLSDNQIQYINQPLTISTSSIETKDIEKTLPEKAVPAIFAGILYFTIFTSGTMTFQSALQEKKDKMVELVLSSIKSEDLMQGKILGYFVLGLIQIAVWLTFGIPIAQIYFKLPILQYLLVPELIPMAFFALAGYLMYSSIFVAIGSTMEDMQSGSSFQGTVFLIPMLPVFVIGPILANPSGIIALFGTYFPLTAPGVMLARLSISGNLPLWEILISAVILLATIFLIMRLAGKLFRVAILMYGKDASFTEVIKWLRY
ncbi:MAG: hypothetical protein APF84_01365 [Gracilibacter sp. BRH_c7a]|nr:MAG: hypothetical protein APF84_01365 [Gracilibacter sp. BRH_c7a]